MDMLLLIVIFVAAYLIGAIPTSILVCKKLKGIDIRTVGSGNAGATNVYRVMGLKVAIMVLSFDALKGALCTSLPGVIAHESSIWFKILGGLLAIVGHIWTIFAGFRGGKGIGPALGVFIALTPIPALIALFVWIISMLFSRIVSLSSLLAALALAISSWILHKTGALNINTSLVWFSTFVAVLVFLTHRKNIQRLIAGTEKRISSSKENSNEKAA